MQPRIKLLSLEFFFLKITLAVAGSAAVMSVTASHAEASKLVLEHRCQPCQPCQIMPGDPVDLRNSHANKGRKLSAPNNRALFGLSKTQHLNTRPPQNVGSFGLP